MSMNSRNLWVALLLGLGLAGTSASAGEFSLHGVKDRAEAGKIRVELTQVTLEESDAAAAINLSLVVTQPAGKPEAVLLTIPATTRRGEVPWSGGTLALTRVEGLDRYFHTSPGKIVWWSELLPRPGATESAKSTPAIDAGSAADAPKPRAHVIDGRQVTEAAYHKLLKSLVGQEHWYCAETRGGGETSWEAKDASGRRYRIKSESGEVNRSSITRITPLGP
jgi:hypothetical protein